jgi:transmembrane sensor
MLTTGRDDGVAHRPFLLQTVQGELRPIGTRFSVRQQTNVSRLDVFEGAVEIRPRDGAGLTRILQAGERASFTYSGIGTIAAANEMDSAWTEDMIVASGMRLQDFIAELSRHRRGRLTCDPAIAELRVSGTYPLNDSDLILDALRSSLPIEAHFMTRYWVTLRAKEAI